MRVCVMVCGRVAEPLADVMPPYPVGFERLLGPHLSEAEFTALSAIDGEAPADVRAHDVYLFTGSPHGVYEDLPWIRAAEALVRAAVAADRVVIGGCFGHQLVAKALGGTVVKSDRGWGLGAHCYTIAAREPWMDGGPDRINSLVSHQDQVIRPPDGAVVLAANDFCPYAMLRIGERVLTIQSHPEMNLATADRLLDLRRERAGDDVHAAGKASLGLPLHHDVIARWMAGFIRQSLPAAADHDSG